MVTKILLFLLSFFVVLSVYGKRKELSLSQLNDQYPVQIVGKVVSLKNNVFNIFILKEKTNSLNGEIKLDGENPLQKPNENPQVGGVYLFFLKKKNSGNFEIGRSAEIHDYVISDEEMKFKAIKTECIPVSVSCIFKK